MRLGVGGRLEVGLQVSRCVHSGCGMQTGTQHTLDDSPSSCTPCSSLASATWLPWCVTGLYKRTTVGTRHTEVSHREGKGAKQAQSTELAQYFRANLEPMLLIVHYQ